MPALTCLRSLRASRRDMRPLTLRAERRSHDFTRRAVAGPYWPSTAVLMPTRERKSWRTRTSRPAMPWRRFRSPSVSRWAAFASATENIGTAAPAIARTVANVRQRDNTTPFLQPPTGLAVGLARKNSRYAIQWRFAPGPQIPRANWVPRSRRDPPDDDETRRYVPFRSAAL